MGNVKDDNEVHNGEEGRCCVCGEKWSKPLCDACRGRGYHREGTVILLNGKVAGTVPSGSNEAGDVK